MHEVKCIKHGVSFVVCINWRMQYYVCNVCVDDAVCTGKLNSDYDPEFFEMSREFRKGKKCENIYLEWV